jgi:6-pyruvoyltetrahydropterin/6-carboxytetrahydropterin synthase
MYRAGKTYGHDEGLSVTFRQWKADSHCAGPHGYALSVHFEFACNDADLDIRNWVTDFGGLKALKARMKELFDHTWLIAEDDPCKDDIVALLTKMRKGRAILLPRIGCEAFAKLCYDEGIKWLCGSGQEKRIWIHHVTIREHGANSATYEPDRQGLIDCTALPE